MNDNDGLEVGGPVVNAAAGVHVVLPAAVAMGGEAIAAGSNNNNNNNNINFVQGKIPSRRFGYVSVVHESKFVLFGGFDGSRWLNDMYVFDFANKCWTEIQARGSLPSARSCPAWAKDESYVYIQGGYDGVERKADFFALDLSTYTWSEMPCLGTPPSPRYFHSCCLYGNRMYLYGGYSGSERLDDMYAYDFETNHWSQIDCTSGDAPSGRSSLVAQVHMNCIYVFGGYNGSTVLNDFFRFRLKPIGVPPPALVSDFQRLINNEELADIRFIVENKKVYAHRAVLAIRSEYFRVMLCGGMRESQNNTQNMMMIDSAVSLNNNDHNNNEVDASSMMDYHNGLQPIILPDISYPVFLKVLEYLYTDSVGTVTLETGIPLLIASEQFMLDRLKALCEDLIRRDISTETVVSILVASHRHHAIGLKDIALEYILSHLSDPIIMSGLSDLKAEPDLLLEIIRRNTNNINGSALSSSSSSSANNGPMGNTSNNNIISRGSAVGGGSVAALGGGAAAMVGNHYHFDVNNNNNNNNPNIADNNNNNMNNVVVGPFGNNGDWSARR
jgi:leucine-zipper-like transcriptional regulator 1